MRYLSLLVFVFTPALAEDLLADFSKGNIRFAADIYKHVRKIRTHDFLVSPLSLEIVLSLIGVGAKGQTAQQISSVLHLPDISEKTTLLTSIMKANAEYNLSSANKLYLADNLKISDSFKRTATTVFNAKTENIDFRNSTQAAAEINKWVQNNTRGNIKNLVKPRDIEPSTVAVLLNTISFARQWRPRFPEFVTKERPFHLNYKERVEINIMERTAEYNYYESSRLKAKFLELRHHKSNVTTTIVLPNKVEGLRILEGRIVDALKAPQYKKELVKVVLPIFQMETSVRFKPILQALGIKDAFEDRADFSGITREHNMKISKVIQKAFISIYEGAAKAHAGNAATFVPRMKSDPPHHKNFTADHPFLFYLKHEGSIMFVGRYVSGAEMP